MTKKYFNLACIFLIMLVFVSQPAKILSAQPPVTSVSGKVIESGSGLPLKQVSVSVAGTGTSSITDEEGNFSIEVPDLQAELIVNLPGYTLRNIYLNGRDDLEVTLVSSGYRSIDEVYYSPFGEFIMKDATFNTVSIPAREMKFSHNTSYDQALGGKIAGLRVIRQSGMPGQRTYMNIRGISSLYANSEPMVFIDGMIHDYAYANISLMEGFALNPMDVVDIEDITDISVLKDGLSFLGAAGGNGAIYINTEQKAEASTVIRFSSYGGVSLAPQSQELLNASQFVDYFNEIIRTRGYSSDQINSMFPWMAGNTAAPEFYRYNNNTDWQQEIFRPSVVTKHHFFLKGGDEIATYNLSTGYQRHNGMYDNSFYNRFNLRVNGTVNITNKFTITPNVKLSVADSKLANHGPSAWKNPTLSSVLIPGNMAPNARDGSTGEFLNYLDDVGVFNVSNPSAIVQNALGTNRNYHFLSSATARYTINENLSISTVIGINFNNARENIFLPNTGIVQVDSSYNSPGDFIYEFRSTQNHSTIRYHKSLPSGHSFLFNGGLRYVLNSYKYNLSRDLNTPSDDFKRLGQGAQYSYLRSTIGDNRGLSWISYFGHLNYDYKNKYYLSANISYDGNSATNQDSRYNLFPSVGAAWRLSSEQFLQNVSWLEDLKIRGSLSQTGNMFSTIYDYSKLYYTSRRMNASGVLFREAIPNENLELEKKTTFNAGIDLSAFKQLVNLHVDVYQSRVNNLIIQQTLPATYGFTTYFNNGGKLQSTGIEFSADTRVQIGEFTWTFGGTVSKEESTIRELNFLDNSSSFIFTPVNGLGYITKAGHAVNSFYGYKTNGIVTGSEAGKIIGPKGVPLQEGDLLFVDTNGDNMINEADKMIIGDPNPDLFGVLFTGFSFQNFELSALFNYSFGNDIYNYMRNRAEAMDSYSNQSITVLNRWSAGNTSSTMPRANFGDPAGNAVFSDRWIEDGSFFRMRQLTLSYDIPAITGLFNKGIIVYLTATNLFTITKYSGYDPEFMYLNNPFYMGIDYGKIPQTRSFILGLKLDL